MNIREAVETAPLSVLRRDAETLLLHVLGRDRAWLLAHPEAELSPEQASSLNALLTRRAAQEPLQYLTGHQEFMGLDLLVNPHVLIPRPETELLVESVLDWSAEHGGSARDPMCLVDVGTGSGAIALALAHKLERAQVWALDVSPAALAVAQGNAARLQLDNRITFQVSDLLQTVIDGRVCDGKVDAVVSNPPYVPEVDADAMQPEVRDHEPHLALFAGQDGLEIYRRLIPQAWKVLHPGGLLAMEMGYGQQAAMAQLLGVWQHVRFVNDYAGIPRIALAERP